MQKIKIITMLLSSYELSEILLQFEGHEETQYGVPQTIILCSQNRYQVTFATTAIIA